MHVHTVTLKLIDRNTSRSPPAPLWNIYTPQNLYPDLLSLLTTLLNAYSQAYILITLIPVMTSFMTFTRLSVTSADLNLYALQDKEMHHAYNIGLLRF